MREASLLQAREVTYAYPRGRVVLRDVSLDIGHGEILTVLGRNGAGKTTLLNCLGGLFKPQSGCVLVNGENVAAMPDKARARAVGFVSQLASTEIGLEVRDYLVLGDAMRLGMLSVPGERDYERVEQVMDSLGISRLAGRTVSELSGGERQQVEIARSLVQDADLVLMDEPTNHLDFANQGLVLSMIRHLAEQAGKAVVLSSHMPDHAILLGGKAAVLDGDGRLEVGPCDQVVTEDRLARVYGPGVRVIEVPELGRQACLMGTLP